MRVTKKVLAAVLILCMMLQISGAAVIADDAANSRGTEIRDAAALESGEPVRAADIVSVSVEGGKSVSPASGASASAGGESVSSAGGASASAGGDTFSAGSEESHAQSQGEQKSSADEGLSAEPSQAEPEAITDRTELSNQANETETASAVGDSRKSDDGTEALTGNGKAAGDEEAVGSGKAAKDAKVTENKKAGTDAEADEDEDADE